MSLHIKPSDAKRHGQTRGRADARRYSADPQNFDPSENPYGVDSEAKLHEAWEVGYEETFELFKTKP